MKARHGITELKRTLVGMFKLTPGTVERIIQTIHTEGEAADVHKNYMNMDGTTRRLLFKLLHDLGVPDDIHVSPQSDDSADSAPSMGDEDVDPNFDPEEDPEEDQNQQAGSQTSKAAPFEGFKGGFQDFLKEVTISVDSDDPQAKVKMQQKMRKASSSESGARAVARDNVSAAAAKRAGVDKSSPTANIQSRELKRREMAAREERKRLMSKPTRTV